MYFNVTSKNRHVEQFSSYEISSWNRDEADWKVLIVEDYQQIAQITRE